MILKVILKPQNPTCGLLKDNLPALQFLKSLTLFEIEQLLYRNKKPFCLWFALHSILQHIIVHVNRQ